MKYQENSSYSTTAKTGTGSNILAVGWSMAQFIYDKI